MPRLARIRLASIGHPSARFGDLVLDFSEANGIATHSTIWLRNGGGKSSLLNLFFALLRPDRREFLGNKADAKQRRLEDYVQSDDHSVVAAEWELDEPKNGAGRPDGQRRFITGVFYEWRGAAGAQAGELRRLYFSGFASEKEPVLSVIELPIYVQTDGGKRRRTLHTFRETWHRLRDEHPRLQLSTTEHVKEWLKRLEDAGIDPELFLYQVRMNQREGGADEVFRFGDHEQFVDFLLELALDPTHGERVAQNIGTFRRELRQRAQELLPELELISGLSERLSPLCEIADQRTILGTRSAESAAGLHGLSAYVERRFVDLSRDAERLKKEADEAARAEARVSESASVERTRSAQLRAYAVRKRHARIADELERAKKVVESADRARKVWQAAEALSNARRHAQQAEGYRVQLAERQLEHAPGRQELTQLANAYGSAVLHRATALRQQSKEASARAQSHRVIAKEARDRAAVARERRAKNEGKVAGLEAEVARIERLRASLDDRGILRPGELAEDASRRLTEEIEDSERREKAARDALDELGDHKRRIEDERTRVGEERVRVEERRDGLRGTLKEAEVRKSELERSDALLFALEVEEVDLDVLPDSALTLLGTTSSHLVDQLVGHKVDRASDERAIAHLETHGLLPPERDVERVLEAIGKHVSRAWSGWEYLESNAPDPYARRAILEKAPHIALTVVLNESDLDKAIERIEAAELELEGPVVLTTPERFGTNDAAIARVVGPKTDALFDRAAGTKALFERMGRRSSLDALIVYLDERRRELDAVAERLRRFRADYPRGFFAATDADIRALVADAERMKADADRLRKEIDRLESLAAEHRGSIESELRERSGLEKQREAAERYKPEEARLLELLPELERTRSAIAADEEIAAEEMKNAEAREAEAEGADRDAVDAAGRSGEFERELQSITYLEREGLKGQEGDLDRLRAEYDVRKQDYEIAVGEDGLLMLEKSERTYEAEFREKLRLLLKDGITEQEVAGALDGLSAGVSVAKRIEDANDALGSAKGVHGNRAASLKAEKDNLDRALLRLKELEADELPPFAYTALPQQAEAEAAEADRLANDKAEEAAGLKQRADALKKESYEASSIASRLKKDGDRVESLRKAYEDVLSAAAGSGAPIVEVADDAQVADSVEEAEKALAELRKEGARLDEGRLVAGRRIREWAGEPRFEALKNVVAKKLAAADDVTLEVASKDFRGNLELRRDIIQKQVADIEQHRELIVTEAMNAAEDGLALLRSAANYSRLPDHLPGHGGAQFLRISMTLPDDPGERRGRVAALVDELAEAGQLPTGLGLVQRAVRRVARPIKVRVLHPDPDLGRESVEIPEMARFSGGEQLTGAILLYCTLAQLRARSRGEARSATSVLILDNPIGRASRARFLELQREVANAMGVQLVYTTGVNDYEALRTMPKLIRLKNERIDRNTGRQMIEEESRLDAIHLGRAGDGDAQKGDSRPR